MKTGKQQKESIKKKVTRFFDALNVEAALFGAEEK
jgi:hypothetical protein